MEVSIKRIDSSTRNFRLDDSDGLVRHFQDTKNCTREILAQLDKNYYADMISTNDKVILDLGANIGLFAIYVAPYVERVICVEPTPSHFEYLITLTGDDHKIGHIRAALSDKDGATPFFLCPSNSTMNSLVNRGGEKVDVDCYSLPSLLEKIGEPLVDFCKIDIEGSEIAALTEDNIERVSNKIKKYFVEFHEINGVSYTTFRDKYAKIFYKYGYQVRNVGPDALFAWKN